MNKILKLAKFIFLLALVVEPVTVLAEFKGWVYYTMTVPNVGNHKNIQGVLDGTTAYHLASGICSISYSNISDFTPGCGSGGGRFYESSNYQYDYVSNTSNGCLYTGVNYTTVCRTRTARAHKPQKSIDDMCKVKKQIASNPIRLSTGEKIQIEYDYQATTPSKIQFLRYYSSHNSDKTSISAGWTHNYDKRIYFSTEMNGFSYAVITRQYGKLLEFTRPDASSNWTTDADIRPILTSYASYHELKLSNNIREQYDLNGNLIAIIYLNGYQLNFKYYVDNNLLESVTDNLGNILTLTYNAENILSGLRTPDNRQFIYGYVNNRLDSVTNVGDATTKYYIYNDPNQPEYLSGIIDERGNQYSKWTYDTGGKAISGEHANGVEKVTMS